MKLAVSGKGGVGKTTFASLMIRTLNAEGKRVLAIDADPDANLAAGLGIADSDKIVPIAEMEDLIFERTGAKPGSIGGYFKLNPKVDDLPDAVSVGFERIKLMRLGGIKKGGSGCICPESALLRALVMHIVLARDEVVVMDMEAGIEHLGRVNGKSGGQTDRGGGAGTTQHRHRQTYPQTGRRNRAEPHCDCRQQSSRCKRRKISANPPGRF